MAGILLANLLIIAPVVCVWLAKVYAPDLYYQMVQEDSAIEWGTFWAFLLASGLAWVGAVRQRKNDATLPWCFIGICLFCLLVAMEEISWGQRLLGYRPPSYFLEHNFQQEFNVHNITSTKLRKLAVKLVVGGYGVVLPLLLLVPALGRLAARVRLIVPPTALVPAFAVTFLLHAVYPFKFTGEVVELMLGLGFLFALLARVRELPPAASPARAAAPAAEIALYGAIIAVLSLGTGYLSINRSADPQTLAATRLELAALERDLLRVMEERGGKLPKSCKVHKRLYGYVKKYDVDELLELEFSKLSARGVPRERVEFFLDPWNSPYWFRDRCKRDKTRRSTFVYSLGPNRRRDSSKWEVRGDDLGAYLIRTEPDEVAHP